MAYRRNRGFVQPPTESEIQTPKRGNLYYVRLNTPVGILYKFGFTTLQSVEARLSYQGLGDEKYVEEVLFFEPFEDAFEIEAVVHGRFWHERVFGTLGNIDQMPLYKNGQSELYARDILGLDFKYSVAQYNDTKSRIEAKRTGSRATWFAADGFADSPGLRTADMKTAVEDAPSAIQLFFNWLSSLLEGKDVLERRAQERLQEARNRALLAQLKDRISDFRYDPGIKVRVRLAELQRAQLEVDKLN